MFEVNPMYKGPSAPIPNHEPIPNPEPIPYEPLLNPFLTASGSGTRAPERSFRVVSVLLLFCFGKPGLRLKRARARRDGRSSFVALETRHMKRMGLAMFQNGPPKPCGLWDW